MKLDSGKILQELTILTEKIKKEAIELKVLSLEQLNAKQSEDSWSALECIGHLVLYGNYYNKELLNCITSSSLPPSSHFKTGMIGNYFAKLMIPGERMKKMKSPKDKTPILSNLSSEVLDDFIKQQDQLLDILESAKHSNLGKARCSISISKLIKLKLGDTLRFVIFHNWRHMEQAKKVVAVSNR